jgi:hypothetical protein
MAFPGKWIGEQRRRAAGVARVAAYVFFASLVCAALGARVVYADFQEGTLQAGRELAGVADVLGSTKTLFLNGVTMNVSTAVTDQSTHQVLDRFEAICAAHPEFVARAFADAPAALQKKASETIPDARLRLGIVRKEVDGDGALTCFTDDRPTSLRDLPDRLHAFLKSHDLAEFGRFRYVYARARKAGGAQVVTVWTDSGFNLGRMFPARGDAAGFDSPDVPRPPGSKRILSATAAPVPYGLHIYDSTLSSGEVHAFYEAQMASRGWRAAQAPHGDASTSVYVKDTGTMVYVTTGAREGRTVVTTTETARSGTPAEAAVTLSQ